MEFQHYRFDIHQIQTSSFDKYLFFMVFVRYSCILIKITSILLYVKFEFLISSSVGKTTKDSRRIKTTSVTLKKDYLDNTRIAEDL